MVKLKTDYAYEAGRLLYFIFWMFIYIFTIGFIGAMIATALWFFPVAIKYVYMIFTRGLPAASSLIELYIHRHLSELFDWMLSGSIIIQFPLTFFASYLAWMKENPFKVYTVVTKNRFHFER